MSAKVDKSMEKMIEEKQYNWMIKLDTLIISVFNFSTKQHETENYVCMFKAQFKTRYCKPS